MLSEKATSEEGGFTKEKGRITKEKGGFTKPSELW
jgi:hypothetical protein